MKLYLLRHAEAENRSSDFERQLTPKGIEDIKLLADFFKSRKNLKIANVWHSPLVRAKETAEVFCEAMDISPKMKETDLITPGGSAHKLVETLQNENENTLLVSHNPFLESLMSYLLTGDPRGVTIEAKKSSLNCFEKMDYLTQNGETPHYYLKWSLSAKLLS